MPAKVAVVGSVTAGAVGKSNSQQTKPEEPRATSGLVGLANQGATCYLNALIQALYMTPELRAGLYSLDPHDHLFVQGVEEYEKQQALEKAGGQFVDDALLEQLKSMGLNEHGARRSLIAVKNNADAAMEYYWSHESDQGFTAPPAKVKASKKPRLIPLELQRLFSQLQLLNQRAISTEALTNKGFQWQGYDGRVQHDAHELNKLLIDALERSLKNTPGEKLCEQLYRGTLAYQIRCLHCNEVSSRQENFQDLNILVDDCDNMAKSLRRYFAAEILQGDSAYTCDVCNAKRTALRSTVLKQLPPILTFSCLRFRCDRTTNFVRSKITDKAAFPLVLDMAPFVQGSECAGTGEAEEETGSDAELARLREISSRMLWLDEAQEMCLELASRLVLEHGESVQVDQLGTEDVASLLSFASSSSSGAGAGADDAGGGELGEAGEAPSAAAPEKIPANAVLLQGLRGYGPDSLVPLDAELPDSSSQGSLSQHRYELFAVINHRGTAFSGHYFAYIRDCQREGQWSLAVLESAADKLASAASSLDFLSCDPLVCGFLSLGGASKQLRYIMDCCHPVGMVYSTLAGSGRSNRPLLRLDELSREVKVRLESFVSQEEDGSKVSVAARQLSAASSKKGGISTALTDLIKTHPEFFRLQGNDVTTTDTPVEVLSSEDFSSRCVTFAAASTTAAAAAAAGGAANGKPKSKASVSWNVPVGAAGAAVASTEAEFQLAVEATLLQDAAAALLQEKGGDGDGNGADAEQGGGDGWESAATGKKKNKNKKGGTAGAGAGAGAGGVSPGAAAQPSQQQQQQQASPAVQAVAAKLAARFLGNYFEFDDSKVSPLPLASLRKAFEGKDSAYMLVYRRLPCPGLATAVEAVPAAAVATVTHASEPVAPPAYWREIVDEANRELVAQRAEFEDRQNKVQLSVFLSQRMSVCGPLLVPGPGPAGPGLQANSECVLSDASNPAESGGCLRLSLDGRQSVRAAIQQILAKAAEEGATASSGDDDRDGSHSKLVISHLERYGNGYYCLEALDLDATLGEAVAVCKGSGLGLGSGAALMLWNGRDVGGQDVKVGAAGDGGLIHFTVTLLDAAAATPAGSSVEQSGLSEGALVASAEADSTDSSQSFAILGESKLWVQSTLCLAELCTQALALFADTGTGTSASTSTSTGTVVDPSSALIHKVEPSRTSTGCSVVKLLYSQGEALGGLHVSKASDVHGEGHLIIEDCQYALAAAQSRGSDSAAPWLDSGGSSGSGDDTLALAWITRRNLLWTVRIEVDMDGFEEAVGDGTANSLPPMPLAPTGPPQSPTKQGSALSSELPFSSASSSSSSSAGPLTVVVETDHSVTVADLKKAALKKLGWAPVEQWAATTCLTTGEFPAPRWALEEGSRLSAQDCEKAGLRNGSTVFLTLWQPSLVRQSAGTMSKLNLSVTLVRGNDPGMTFNPRQHGQRSTEVRIEVPATSTVRELRDAAGVMLLGLAPGWTAYGSPQAAAFRLREVNAQHENKQLLIETLEKSAGTGTGTGAGVGTSSNGTGTGTGTGGKKGGKAGAAGAAVRANGNNSLSRLAPPQTLKKNKISNGAVLHLEEGSPLYEGIGRYQLLLWMPQGHGAPDRSLPPLALPPLSVFADEPEPIVVANRAGAGGEADAAIAGAAAEPENGPSASSSSCSAVAVAVASSTDAAPALALPVPEDALDLARRRARRHLLPIADLECHDDASLADLQHMVFRLLAGPAATAALAEAQGQTTATTTTAAAVAGDEGASPALLPASVDHFVLRDCRADLLPGQCFWTYEPSAAGSTGLQAYSNIGKAKAATGLGAAAAAAAKVKNVKALSQKLTVHGAGTNKFLVIEVLEKKQQDVRQALGPAGSFRVWAQRLVAPSVAEGAAVLSGLPLGSAGMEEEEMRAAAAAGEFASALTAAAAAVDSDVPPVSALIATPAAITEIVSSSSWSYPPVEIVVAGGTMPGMNHLKRPLCSQFALPNQDTCRVFRWSPQKLLWHEMRLEQAKPYKKKENITEAPFSLSEGDLVCVFAGSALPPVVSQGGAAAVGMREISVSRASDVCLLRRLELSKELKRKKGGRGAGKKGSADGQTAARRVQREAILSIGGELDFSDEDEDEEEEEG